MAVVVSVARLSLDKGTYLLSYVNASYHWAPIAALAEPPTVKSKPKIS